MPCGDGTKGNLYIRFDIVFPQSLEEDKRNELRKLLCWCLSSLYTSFILLTAMNKVPQHFKDRYEAEIEQLLSSNHETIRAKF